MIKSWLLVCVFSCSFVIHLFSQNTTLMWTWKGGPTSYNQAPVFGTKGVADPNNTPGARQNAITWSDPNGIFWLWGGRSSLGQMNDLWKYDPATSLWVWVSGSNSTNQFGIYGTYQVFAAANAPGQRQYAYSWIDKRGHLWLYGGVGQGIINPPGFKDAGYLDDVWQYDPSTNQWAWMAGTQVPGDDQGPHQPIFGGRYAFFLVPGGMANGVSWTDAQGNLWLFGGETGNGFSSSTPDRLSTTAYYNDVWMFNTTNLTWKKVWHDGTHTYIGKYNSKGVELDCALPSDPCSFPTPRAQSSVWKDQKGNIWIFGGINSNGTVGLGLYQYSNDLWRYNPTTNKWTWMAGDPPYQSIAGLAATKYTSINGNYGPTGTSSGAYLPMARAGSITWTDASGKLWLWGGEPLGSTSNDLWNFDINTSEWTWVAGSNPNVVFNTSSDGPTGNYGVLNIPAATNVPGGRHNASVWKSQAGDIWMMGGGGLSDAVTASSGSGLLSDLWTLAPVVSILALPDVNLSCTQSANGNTVLTWTMANAAHYSFIDIERSNGDQKPFNTIHHVIVKNNVLGSFVYEDTAALSGSSTYRIAVTDVYGNKTYTNTCGSDSHIKEGAIKVYPVPANNIVSIASGNDQIEKVQLFNVAGSSLSVPVMKSGSVATLSVSSLSSGVYILQIKTSKTTTIRKLVVQH